MVVVEVLVLVLVVWYKCPGVRNETKICQGGKGAVNGDEERG
jgi:hypothetical protein